jgi:hypothetical protein
MVTWARLAWPMAAALTGGGCFHHETAIPGVLDLRSDGRTAPAREEPLDDPYLKREGFSALLEGDGVHTLGSGVVVEDRAHYLFRFIPIYNGSSTEEIAGALGRDGALRDVSVQESFTSLDITTATVGPAIPLLGVALCALSPPLTTTVKGVRIHAARAPYARTLPSPEEALPLDITTPAAPVERDQSAPLESPRDEPRDEPRDAPRDGDSVDDAALPAESVAPSEGAR